MTSAVDTKSSCGTTWLSHFSETLLAPFWGLLLALHLSLPLLGAQWSRALLAPSQGLCLALHLLLPFHGAQWRLALLAPSQGLLLALHLPLPQPCVTTFTLLAISQPHTLPVSSDFLIHSCAFVAACAHAPGTRTRAFGVSWPLYIGSVVKTLF